MTSRTSPSKVSVQTDPDPLFKKPVNSVYNVPRQHPNLRGLLSKSEAENPFLTCKQLFRQAEELLTEIGYKKGKLIPIVTKTPGRYRQDIRAPGPDIDPVLDPGLIHSVQEFSVPLHTSQSPGKPPPAFREVPKIEKRQVISLRSSRPETNSICRRSDSQVKSHTLRETLLLAEMSAEERAALRQKYEQNVGKLAADVHQIVAQTKVEKNRLGIFPREVNQARADSLFTVTLQSK